VTEVVNEIEVTPDSVATSTDRVALHPIRVALRGLDIDVPDFEFVLSGSRVLIGRVEAADVRLEDPCVSRYHCEIGSINGTLWVRDLGSANGVFVNGFHEVQACLMPGDRLTIGETNFRVEFERHFPKSYEGSLT
jgi:pSer/pThr/pTyr-binding forkhead associated (FHA) protein